MATLLPVVHLPTPTLRLRLVLRPGAAAPSTVLRVPKESPMNVENSPKNAEKPAMSDADLAAD
ncbi:hypothetical protein, partial [Mesorhizobium sp. M1A.T.Ca.IN.004.03.1.1]|uniref:hypothetical protein n=1 Tax=Mesorhizobium sp. M1A.T.Ca.IN.004.03.1.1 TaxID=2496795 RepID=UPI0019D2D7C4